MLQFLDNAGIYEISDLEISVDSELYLTKQNIFGTCKLRCFQACYNHTSKSEIMSGISDEQKILELMEETTKD